MKKIVVIILVCMMVVSINAQNRTYKETLTIAVAAEPTSLDGLYSRNAVSVAANQHLYDYLIYMDEDGILHPMLATSWKFINDKELRFYLRKDVVFHNGQKMTADDVVFSLVRVRDLNQVTWAANFIDKIIKIDDYTVSVTFLEPYAGTAAQFARPGANIVCKAAVEADPAKFKTNPIGTGPYKIVQWSHGSYVKMERNESYWGSKPTHKYLVLKVIPETTQRLIALENGEVDIAIDIAPGDVEKIEANKKLKVNIKPSANIIYVCANLSDEAPTPITNKLVRQAMQYAVDKNALVKAVTDGYGEVSNSIISKGVFGFFDEIKPEYNLEKAKDLMVKAGYEKGFTVDLLTQSSLIHSTTAQILQDMWSKIGIKVNLKTVDFATILTNQIKKDHALYVINWMTVGDAFTTFNPFFRSNSTAAEGNSAFFKNDEVDKLIITAKTSFDDKTRLVAYKRLFEIAAEELPYIPLFCNPIIIGLNAKVENFVASPLMYHRFNTVNVYK